MHPAPSVVLFTVLSGAGYGLLLVMGLGVALRLAPADRLLGTAGLGLALALVTAGLAASTWHLGHPKRAWRALSQWRTSWLSREGVAAAVTYVPALGLAASWVLGAAPSRLLGLLAALCAAATILCTAMIYASLRTVARWHSAWVPITYLALALSTGTVLAWLVWAATIGATAALPGLAAITAIIGWTLKLLAWQATDGARSPADPASATGLGHLGHVRMVEPPHTVDNYLLREMGFRVARKHAAKLRRMAVVLGGVVPAALAVLALPSAMASTQLALALAAGLGSLLGTLIERWLFFAEARHTVILYYGASAA